MLDYESAVITHPTWEPITVSEAKKHLRIVQDEEDDLISMMIVSARLVAEQFTGRALSARTVALYLSHFPRYTQFFNNNSPLLLPFAPVQSVQSVTYIDTSGVLQTLDESLYNAYLNNFRPAIAPVYGQVWPDTRCEMNAVTVNFVAGYARSEEVPSVIKSALLLLVGELYENRENSGPLQIYNVPRAAESLLYPYKIHF